MRELAKVQENVRQSPARSSKKKAIIHFESLLRTYAGAMSDPCCMTEPQLCQKQLWRDRMLSSSVGSWIQGCGGCHSKGVTLQWGGLKEDGRTDVRIAGQKEKTGSLGTILPSSSPSSTEQHLGRAAAKSLTFSLPTFEYILITNQQSVRPLQVHFDVGQNSFRTHVRPPFHSDTI